MENRRSIYLRTWRFGVLIGSEILRYKTAEPEEPGMKILKAGIAAAILLGCALALGDVGPKWPTDRYRAFAEAAKKKKLIFLYYTSTT